MTSSATITAVELPGHCKNPPYQFVAQLIMHLSLIHYSFSSLPKNYFWGHIRYHNCSSLTQALLQVYFKAVSIHWHSMVVWLHGYGCCNKLVKDTWRSLHKWQHVILPTYMWKQPDPSQFDSKEQCEIQFQEGQWKARAGLRLPWRDDPA